MWGLKQLNNLWRINRDLGMIIKKNGYRRRGAIFRIYAEESNQGCHWPAVLSHKLWNKKLLKFLRHVHITIVITDYKRKQIVDTHVCQHLLIISAMAGSISSGMSRRRCWNPTAPTTCIGFIPPHGCCNVESSHKITP